MNVPMKAQYGQYSVEVYSLPTPKSGWVALTYLPASSQQPYLGTLVFNSGMFSNRRFWLSDKGIGIAAWLSSYGFDCWMFERRGLGASAGSDPAQQHLFNAFQLDLPAVQQFLTARGVTSAFYVGHSFGGVLNGLSLAKGYMQAEQVAGLINISSQLTVGKRLLNKPYSAIVYGVTGLLRHFPARRLGMGPENESVEAMRDCCRLVAWAKKEQGRDFWQGFENITCPVLGIGSEGDSVDPAEGCQQFVAAMGSQDNTFIRLGKKHGHRQDYDHVSLVVSKDAQQEVWPMLLTWLQQRVAQSKSTD